MPDEPPHADPHVRWFSAGVTFLERREWLASSVTGVSMLYLAYLDGHELGPSAAGPWQALHVLRPGLVLIASEESRSAVYHALKDHLPHGAALLVAACNEVPKFKGMAAGTLTFARHHVDAARTR